LDRWKLSGGEQFRDYLRLSFFERHSRTLGRNAGYNNTEGGGNVFLDLEAGFSNTTGADNALFGTFAGWSNTSGNYNTLIGRGLKGAAGDLTNALP
jgi:hypothetical protein